MTPQARVAAAIEVLDLILDGEPAEKTLTTWARKNRYAGSKDRAALRDHVFDALRQKRSSAYMGGSETGRGIMIGQMRLQGADPEQVFSGQGYAPPALSDAERAGRAAVLSDASEPVRLDCPDWVFPLLKTSLGAQTAEVLAQMRTRAPIFLRANIARCTPLKAISVLAQDDIEAVQHPLSPTALDVVRNPRQVRQSRAFLDGLVELQDAASQAVSDFLASTMADLCHPLPENLTLLDYCAGGGGKSLALAAKGTTVTAHDIDPARMNDIPERARRAGVQIGIDPDPQGAFDAVFCDAPCSGTGAWRRQPDAKWRLTPAALGALTAAQDAILDRARTLVKEGGILAYATCSMLHDENDGRIKAFCARHSDWALHAKRQFTPLDGADGFFIAILTRG